MCCPAESLAVAYWRGSRATPATAPPARVREGTPARPPLPGWLVVGATGRNTGKSDLACAIIARCHTSHDIVAVKVTTVAADDSTCPRGGAGCGACTSLDGDFAISDETDGPPGKDTTRMRASGARRVLWLRCRRPALRTALAALCARVGSGSLVVAESTSLALAVEPDLFLVVRPATSSAVKPSAAAALPLAQRVVAGVDRHYDLDLRQLVAVDGRWHLVEASAVILAGGASRRMGTDKSLLAVAGKPLIERVHEQLVQRFADIVVSADDDGRHAALGARVVPDLAPGLGPLMGIRTAVEAARHDRVFVAACDIPVVDATTVDRMLVLAADHDCVVPMSWRGLEPLFAVYRKSALPAMAEALAAGERRISAVLPHVRTRFFELGPAPWLANLNTRADVAAFLAGQQGGGTVLAQSDLSG